MPQVGATCDIVMQHLDPIHETRGLYVRRSMSTRSPTRCEPAVLNVLNTGATFQVVQRERNEASRYYIHKDLYKTLARIRAREFARGASNSPCAGRAGHGREGKLGGSLTRSARRSRISRLSLQPSKVGTTTYARISWLRWSMHSAWPHSRSSTFRLRVPCGDGRERGLCSCAPEQSASRSGADRA